MPDVCTWTFRKANLAEREGFEPPIPVKVCPLSRRIVSTTHAPLRAVKFVVSNILAGRARFSRSGFDRGISYLLFLLLRKKS